MLTFRRIQSDEGPKFRAIRLQAIQDAPTAFASTLGDTEARSDEYWQERATTGAEGRHSVLFVASDDDRWVGMAGGYIGEARDPRTVDLISMWVHPEYRGHGIGQKLVQQVVDWAREGGLEAMYLEVTEINTSAISLYKRCGFKNTGEIGALPSHPELVERRMVLELV